MPQNYSQSVVDKQTSTLHTFSRALGREAHVLTQHPELLWQQMYNRLQLEGAEVKQVKSFKLARCSVHFAKLGLWLHINLFTTNIA